MSTDRIIELTGLLSAALVLVGVAIVLLLREATTRDLEQRITTTMDSDLTRGGHAPRSRFRAFTGALRHLGERARASSHLYSQQDVAALEVTIAASGYNPRRALTIVLGTKVLLLFLVPGATFIACVAIGVAGMREIAAIGIALAIAVLVPDSLLRLLRRRYTAALRRGIADALDLLVVCAEAGMGLEGALEQVATEMRFSNPAMAAALSMLLDELKVLPDRREAFVNFGKRSGVEGIRRMATILSQALQHGTPLGQALRAVAVELRRERMLRLEEKATRLPALLVLPLILFILPPLLIILVGGPMLNLFDMLHAAALHVPGR
jgi:tight adherence protein C